MRFWDALSETQIVITKDSRFDQPYKRVQTGDSRKTVRQKEAIADVSCGG
jgi:hypothetical protein